MAEVDWLLDQLARTLDERDAAIAALRPAARDTEDAEDTDPGGVPATPAGDDEERADA
jgi:hypothetical protein